MPFRTTESSPAPFVPKDPFERFMQLHHALEEGRGFLGDKVPLRFSAVTLLTTPGEPEALAAALRDKDSQLAERLGWLSDVGSSMRLLVSALLVKYDDEAGAFLDEVERAREMMRARKLRRGGAYEFLAVLVLRRVRDGESVTDADIERFQALYEEMKRHHWWLTGPEDFPACAMLVGREGEPRAIGDGIEAIYQALRREAGLATGDPLQTAANVLYLSGLEPLEVARRFALLRDGFKRAGQKIWQREYDELATLCFLARPVEAIVASVLEHRDRLEEHISWLPRPMAFGLGAGIAFVRLLGRDDQLGALADAKVLLDMQGIIAARQAAAVAVAAT